MCVCYHLISVSQVEDFVTSIMQMCFLILQSSIYKKILLRILINSTHALCASPCHLTWMHIYECRKVAKTQLLSLRLLVLAYNDCRLCPCISSNCNTLEHSRKLILFNLLNKGHNKNCYECSMYIIIVQVMHGPCSHVYDMYSNVAVSCIQYLSNSDPTPQTKNI